MADKKKDDNLAASGILVLPCSGLDKEVGAVSRELALMLEERGATLVCPVLYQHSPKRYEKELASGQLMVIDGCKTGCAGKLAKERGLRIDRKLTITEALKDLDIKPGKEPRAGSRAIEALPKLADGLMEERPVAETIKTEAFTAPVEYREIVQGKFIFRVPAFGFLFNDNDCWARVEGNVARIGVSDYVQQSASDVVLYEPPEVGKTVEQFDDAGALETTKTALDIISPVSGVVIAINEKVALEPEIINSDPYGGGWTCAVELADISEDKELLMDCDRYFEHLVEKIRKEHEQVYGG